MSIGHVTSSRAPTGTDTLENVDVSIERNGTGSDVAEVIGIIFATLLTLGLFWVFFRQSRLVFDNFSEKDEEGLRQLGRDIVASPAGPRLRAHYQELVRQNGEGAFNILRAEVEAALVRANPEMARNDREELNRAAFSVASGVHRALEADIRYPSSNDGLMALTSEYEMTAPRAVGRAQGSAFARFPELMHQATELDERALDRGGVALLGAMFGLFPLVTEVADAGNEMRRGTVTGEELEALAQRARFLPDADRRLMGAMLASMVERNQIRIIKAPAGAVDTLITNLRGAAPITEDEAATARLLADVCTADYVFAEIADRSSGALTSEEEAQLRAFKNILTADLAATPASVQRLARAQIAGYLARVPATVTSETMTTLRRLFPTQ